MVLSALRETDAFKPRRWIALIPAAIVFGVLLTTYGIGADLLASMASQLPGQSILAALGSGVFAYGIAIALLVVGYTQHGGMETLLDDAAMVFMLFGTAITLGNLGVFSFIGSFVGVEMASLNFAQLTFFSPTTAITLGLAFFSLALATRIPGPWMMD